MKYRVRLVKYIEYFASITAEDIEEAEDSAIELARFEIFDDFEEGDIEWEVMETEEE